MLERNELITVCRHIGGMMEAGVDILRITRVLRAQTETPRLLQLYDALDRDMTMGRSLAEAMSRAPDVFSPFVVQMIQQGEARNDLAGAFLKVADFLKQEQELDEESAIRESSIRDTNRDTIRDSDRESSTREVAGRRASDNVGADARDETSLSRNVAPDLLPRTSASPLTVIALDGLMDRLQTFMLRALTITAGLMLSLASVWWLLELGYVEKRWSMPVAFSVTAVFLGGAGSWIQRRIRSERRREARCSFCGRQGIDLQRAPRFAGAAICARCAAIVAKKSEEDAVATPQTPPDSATTNNATSPDAISADANSNPTNSTSSTRSRGIAGAASGVPATNESGDEDEAVSAASSPTSSPAPSAKTNFDVSVKANSKANSDANVNANFGATSRKADVKNASRARANGGTPSRAAASVVDEEDYE